MKKLSKLFVSSLFLSLILACLIPATGAFAQGSHAVQSAHAAIPLTNPSCYGDGLPRNNPPIQGCDGLDQSICHYQLLEQAKLIGSSDGEGVLGQLQIYYSPTNNNGCNAWHAAINITHTGCYLVLNDTSAETGSDYSGEQAPQPHSVCKGQWYNAPMVGDNTGGCYYAYSTVADASGNPGNTSTSTFCY